MNELVMVFSMEKVGSSTCMGAFRQLGLNPDRGTRHNLGYLGSPDRYMGIVTPVRDPVARNLSYFFETHGNDILPTKPSNEDIFDMFMERVRHEEPVTWFEEVYTPFIGVDPLRRSFPKKLGWAIYNKKLLIIQTERMDAELSNAFRTFFGHGITIEYRGRKTESRTYGKLYKRFVNWVRFPKKYLSPLLNSKYVEHFYTKDDQERMWKRWESRS